MFRQFEPPKIKRCFLVGCGRSGTSILGSLLGSMKKVTFSYEPEIFYGVYGKVDLNEDVLRKELITSMVDRCCYFDIKSRRAVNINPKEDSYFLKTDVSNEENVTNPHSVNLIKLAGLNFAVNKVKDDFPDAFFLGIVRNPHDVVQSVCARGWFDTPFSKGCYFWKTRSADSRGVVPIFVADKHIDLWLGGTKSDRALIYYVEQNRALCDSNTNMMITYEKLVKEPKWAATCFSQIFKVEPSSKTVQIVNQIDKFKLRERFDAYDAADDLKRAALELYDKLNSVCENNYRAIL